MGRTHSQSQNKQNQRNAPRNTAHPKQGGAADENQQRIDWLRTLAAKKNQSLQPKHIRRKKPPPTSARLHCVLVDCSASMLAQQRLSWVKGLLLQWSQQVYNQRDWLMVVGFAGSSAQLLHPPRKAQPFNTDWIAPIAGGGDTPVQAALDLAQITIANAAKKASGIPAHTRLWLISDMRFAQLPDRPGFVDSCTIVDCEAAAQRIQLGRGRLLAENWQADYLNVARLAQRAFQ